MLCVVFRDVFWALLVFADVDNKKKSQCSIDLWQSFVRLVFFGRLLLENVSQFMVPMLNLFILHLFVLLLFLFFLCTVCGHSRNDNAH